MLPVPVCLLVSRRISKRLRDISVGPALLLSLTRALPGRDHMSDFDANTEPRSNRAKQLNAIGKPVLWALHFIRRLARTMESMSVSVEKRVPREASPRPDRSRGLPALLRQASRKYLYLDTGAAKSSHCIYIARNPSLSWSKRHTSLHTWGGGGTRRVRTGTPPGPCPAPTS